MHPPFFTVDHKIRADIHHHDGHKPVKRRSFPARLRLTPATTGWPPIMLQPVGSEDSGSIQAPTGQAIACRPRLQIVPPPRRSLRDVIGRLLIRTGQRMILSGRPG